MAYYTERISFGRKNADNKKWYRDKADYYDSFSSINNDDYRRMKANYDLFNNKINIKDFEYICKPFGNEVGELPSRMTNKDIVSGKIKALMGMESRRPFEYKVIAVNSEATTRKEKEKFDRIKEYVINSIMNPIRKQMELKAMQQTQGQELTEEQMKQINAQIEEETKSMTPEEVVRYMSREHQDPAEVLGNQILDYLVLKLNVKDKFNKMFKHGLISARSIMYIGILNREPCLWNVNTLRFNFGKSPDDEFIEDADWCTCEYRMTASQIIKHFADDLSQKEIDTIFKYQNDYQTDSDYFDMLDSDDVNDGCISVVHCVWKSLRKIGFLTYHDDNDNEQVILVDENYRINKDAGDIKIEWKWIPEVYECWKIKLPETIYVNMRPVPNQYKDLDNLYHCKLPYYGVVYDNTNSSETSLMDRLSQYQYYYNIIMYRLELLLASDKGKKVFMNINAIPDDMGIDLAKWQYFAESTPYLWFNPNEEGTTPYDVNNSAKVLDLSLISDIKKYIDIAEYIRQQCGKSVGITDNIEGQIGSYDSVRNVQQSLMQSAYILEPYFRLHDLCKRNILQGLLEASKIAYSKNKPLKLSYILDDVSVAILDIDSELLDNTTYGIFISDNSKAQYIKENIHQLAHAAMQNQVADFSDIINILRQDDVVVAQETLKSAEERKRQEVANNQKMKQESDSQLEDKKHQMQMEIFEKQKELLIIKEEERRKTEIIKASLLGASFNPNKDSDNDGKNDFLQNVDIQSYLNPPVKNDENDKQDVMQVDEQDVQDYEENNEKNNNENYNKNMTNYIRKYVKNSMKH